MAEEKSGLSNSFMKAAKHLVMPTMVAMMTVMAFPAVAAAAPAGAATLGDLGLGLVDHYGTMLTAPFTESGMLGDVIQNTAEGKFAPSSYELGMAADMHGGMDMAGMDHGADAADHAGHEDPTNAFKDAADDHAHHQHGPQISQESAPPQNTCTTEAFNEWSGSLSEGAREFYEQQADPESLESYYQDNICQAPTPMV